MAEGADRMIEKARELVSNRLLWPLVRDFLWDFAPSIHESWIKEALGETSTLQNLQASSRVKRYVLSSLGVEPCFHTFPKEDGSRLLLLDGATLESVAKWLGALACADALRRMTAGAAVRELKKTLPGIYPEVFGYTMYFGSLEAWKLGSLEEEGRKSGGAEKFGGLEVEKVGSGILLQSLSSLPAPLVHRLELKLPKSLTGLEPPNRKASQLSNLQTSISKLLKLKFPEAYKLCCS